MNHKRASAIGILMLIPMTAACNAIDTSTRIENKRAGYVQTQPTSTHSGTGIDVQTPAAIKPLSTSPPKLVLSSFRTRILDRDRNRLANIRLAASKLENHVVKSGLIFSFNSVVGKRDADHGFRKAEIIVDGERDEGTGGGVCQLSSTLFNAVQLAGMRTMERHSHSREVHYVRKGSDAAVDYGNLDYKFMNTLGHAVRIKVIVGEKSLEVRILRNDN